MDKAGRLLLLGAGGHGRVAADLAELDGWEDIAFLDDVFPEPRESGAWPILGSLEAAFDLIAAGATGFVSLGNNVARLALLRQLRQRSFEMPTLTHPSAVVSRHAHIGEGSIICAGAVIGPFARLGQGVIVNTGASVDHDCRVGDGVHVSPGARLSGGVEVGERTWIGVGAVVRESVVIGSDVMVGAGAAVVRTIADGATALGVPARP